MAVPSLFVKEAAKGVVRNEVKEAMEGPPPEIFTREKKKKAPKPGEHWTNPLNEQHPDVNRFFLMNFESATPQTMGRALAENFEVRHRGGLDFSIRKPGEKKWRVVDPRTWTDWIPFWGPSGGDWSDLAGDLFTGILSGIGGTIGAATGTGVLPGGGTAIGAAKGAAAGAALGESAKQLVGKLLGGHATAGEAGQSIATEAILGGVSEPVAQFAAPVVKGALGKAKTALLGDAAEVAAKNIEAAETAAKAGAARPAMEEATEGVLPALTRKGETLADEIAVQDVRSVADLLDLPEPQLRSEAAQRGIRLSEEVPIEEVRSALLKQSEQDLAGEVRRLENAILKAENVQTRPISKATVQEMSSSYPHLRTLKPQARNTAIRRIMLEEVPMLEKQLQKAQRALGRGPRVPKRETVALQAGISRGDKEALEEAARLGVDIPEKARGSLAREVLEAETTEGQRAALGRQVDRRLRELEPYEPLEIEHVLTRESAATGLPAGEIRTYKGTLKPEVSVPDYRAAEAEVAGMSLDEAQRHLQDIGWQGAVPDTLEGVTDKVYARRYLGLKGGEDATRSAALAGPFFDPGTPTRWHKARKDLITGITAGGETFRPGAGAIQHPTAAAAAKWASKPANWVGRGLQRAGEAMQLPAKAGHAAAGAVLGEKGAEYATRRSLLAGGFGAGLVGSPAVAGAVAGGVGLEILGRGVASVGRKLAADDSGQALIRLASSAPERVARKMWPVVEKLNTGVIWGSEREAIRSYRAGLYAMMHDPEIRHFLRKYEEEK